jgi:membrane-associated phospholipid phosphatase
MSTIRAIAPARTQSIARLITEIAAPWVWCVSLPYAVGLGGTWSLWTGLGWATLIMIGGAVVPMGLILRGMRKGTVQSGHHLTSRIERYVPLIGALISMGIVVAALIIGDAPPPMVGVAAVMLSTVIVCLAITHWWKISMHTAVGTGATVVLMIFYGWRLGLLWIVVAAVAWSRVQLRHHTPTQVVAGIAVGTGTGALFALLS